MLHIDSLLLEAFYNENKSFFENARVQKIQQPTRREIVLQLRNNSETKKLYININPNFYHICFLTPSGEQKRHIEIPKQPPMFCMLLRKHMEGAKILRLNKPEFERIIELTFENYNELGDRIEECLSIELMGKHSNIVLYNSDNNIILGCAHNIGAEKSKERELAGGLPYIYPPRRDKKNLKKTTFAVFEKVLKKSNDTTKKTINASFYSLSQYLVQEICENQRINPEKPANELTTEEIQKLFVAFHEFFEDAGGLHFSVSADYEKYSCVNSLEYTYNTVNELIDDYFSHNIEKQLVFDLKNKLREKINKELKRHKASLNSQKKQLEKKDKTEQYRIKGDLLTANSYKIKSLEKVVVLQDFETGKDIEIELDETKSPIENAQRYYALYNKGKKAFKVALEMSEKTQEEINACNQCLYETDICSSYSELKDIAQELLPENIPSKNKKDKAINLTKTEIDGLTVYIGKNNKQNDYLYSKISSPEDLWFHVLNTPGSHIIVKKQNQQQSLKDESILKIAQLAKEYSTAKNSAKVPVVYTLRKYIKRPNNTKSGFVVYKNETEIVVE